MERFLIEVTHEPDQLACTHAVQQLLTTGTHFLTHADLGCRDGVHKAWLIVEVADRDEALHIVPPAFRPHTKVVRLNRFSLEELDVLLAEHTALPSDH